MRDERGKKKLEVLISSSSQVKILLTMDDQRSEGEKSKPNGGFGVLKKEIQSVRDKWRNVHHIKDIRMTPLPSDTL